jgi:hypothetical protein
MDTVAGIRVEQSPGDLSGVVFPAVQATLQGLEIPAHDYIGMTYTGSNLTGVVYKDGGSGGTTVATLTLTYDGSSNLTSVTKS